MLSIAKKEGVGVINRLSTRRNVHRNKLNTPLSNILPKNSKHRIKNRFYCFLLTQGRPYGRTNAEIET